MGLIKYENKTILEAKTKIDVCNDNILNALGKIKNELINMESTFSTPNSKETISVYTDYMDNRIKLVTNNRNYYNNTIAEINDSYTEYLSSVNEMVGVKND